MAEENKEKDILEDLASVTLKEPLTEKDKEIIAEQEPGSVVISGGTSESTELKKKMLIDKEKKKAEKCPEHIRKVIIIINDKKPNDPVSVTFVGVWTGSDLNLAGKQLILNFNVHVRNRAIRK